MSEYQDIFGDVDDDSNEFAYLSSRLILRIRESLRRQNMSQTALSERLKKKDSEVSKWLGGLHNLTLRNLARINVALGERVIDVKDAVEFQALISSYSISAVDSPEVLSATNSKMIDGRSLTPSTMTPSKRAAEMMGKLIQFNEKAASDWNGSYTPTSAVPDPNGGYASAS